MVNLAQLSQAAIALSLDDWVNLVNELLPQFVPRDQGASSPENASSNANSNAGESISPRLVRYYVAEGVLDRPERKGRGAFYGYRQSLQILLVRRLLAEGYGLGAIAPLLQEKTNGELEALLQGGIQLTLAAANPALAFLQQLRRRQPNGPSSSALPSPAGPGLADPGLADPGDSRSGLSSSEPSQTGRAKSSLKTPSPKRNAPLAAQSAPLAAPTPPLPPSAPAELPAAAPPSAVCETWQRFSLLPGLELHIRQGFPWPQTPQEQHNLLQRIIEPIQALLQQAKAKS